MSSDDIIKSFTKLKTISSDILWEIRTTSEGSMPIKDLYNLKDYSRKEIDSNILYFIKSGYLIPYFKEDELILKFNPLIEENLTMYHLFKKFNDKEEIRQAIKEKKAMLDSKNKEINSEEVNEKKEIDLYILKEKVKDLSRLYENFEEINKYYKNIPVDRNPGSLFESYLEEEYDSF